MTTINVGDVVTRYEPDTRRLVRLWCWLTGKPRPTRLVRYKVTTVGTAGCWLGHKGA